MSDQAQRPHRRFGPFLYAPKPHRRGDYFHVKVALVMGLISAAAHDVFYRQTLPQGEGDFELWGTISHAGLDMLIVTAVIATSLWAVEWLPRWLAERKRAR